MDIFGDRFSIELFGASHAPEVGAVIRGIPAELPLDPADFTADLLRRKSGAKGTTARLEDDIPEIDDRRAEDGSVVISFANRNIRPEDYSRFLDIPRPGHADFVAARRYGSLLDGKFSGRMTLPLVAAGVIAKKLVAPVRIEARLTEIGGVAAGTPEADAALEEAMAQGDSLGGIVECVCTGVPVGLGEPFFVTSLPRALLYPRHPRGGVRRWVRSLKDERVRAQRPDCGCNRQDAAQRCRRHQRRTLERQPGCVQDRCKADVKHT